MLIIRNKELYDHDLHSVLTRLQSGFALDYID